MPPAPPCLQISSTESFLSDKFNVLAQGTGRQCRQEIQATVVAICASLWVGSELPNDTDIRAWK